MASMTVPFATGSSALAAYSTVLSVNLGRMWIVNGAAWRLVKAAAALTTMGRAVVVSALSGGLPTFSVNTTTTADNHLVVGVFPSNQVDLASGDFALVQCSGYGEVISAAAIADGAAVGTSTTAKKCDDASITVKGTIGYVLESAAGADENVGIRFCNLI